MKSTKISVQTPTELYKEIFLRKTDLNLHFKDYLAVLAIIERGMLKDEKLNKKYKDFLTPELVEAGMQVLKEMEKDSKN